MALGQGQSTKSETEVINLTYHGFEPGRIDLKPGPIQLSIHNATRHPSLQFVLQDQKGNVVVPGVSLGSSAASHGRNSMVTLAVGTYTLKVTELPTYTMQIVVK